MSSIIMTIVLFREASPSAKCRRGCVVDQRESIAEGYEADFVEVLDRFGSQVLMCERRWRRKAVEAVQ